MSLILLVNTHSSGRRARHRLWPFLALLPFLLLAACTSPEQREAQHFERALALYEEGEDAKAMVEFNNVLQLNSKNADALYHIGLIHERAGRIPAALESFQRAVAERPDFVVANIRLGNIALGSHQLDIVERAVEAVQQVAPDNSDALALKAALLLNRDDLEGARAAAEVALAKVPDDERASAVMIGILLKEGRRNAALQSLEEAIASHPDSTNLLTFKLLLQESMGATEGAAETFARLLELDPSDTRYHLGLARFLQRQGDISGAEAVLRDALDKASDVTEITGALARLVYQNEGASAAEETLQELLERRPEDTSLRFMLAELYQRQQRPADAEALLEAIVERGESKTSVNDARVALGRLKLAQGDSESTTRLLAEVLADDPGHDGALVLQGTVALEGGRLDDAIRSARTALRNDPNLPSALRLAADAHERKGEVDIAIDALSILIGVNPRDARSAEHLATLLIDRGDLAAALKVWDHVVDTGTDVSTALGARAVIAMEQGNFEAARADIDRLLQMPEQQARGALLRGHLAVAQGRPKEGRDWFVRAETLAPSALGPMTAIAHTFMMDDDIEGMLAYLDGRIRGQPEDIAALDLKGQMLVRAGRFEEAQAALTEAIRLDPTATTSYRSLGQAQLAAGRLEEAFATYATALEKAPDDAELLYELARAYQANARLDDALATYEHLADLRPENPIVINNYAALVADLRYQEPERLERALALAERFGASDNPHFLDTLGWLHYRNGDPATATSFLERAVALAPDAPAFRYHLGMALQASGRKEEALAQLERAVSDGADYHGVDEARATLADLQKQLPDTARQGAGADRAS